MLVYIVLRRWCIESMILKNACESAPWPASVAFVRPYLESGRCRHLMTTPSELYNTMECDEEFLLPNGESLKI
ncbi:unnamed protein product [Albugo candida]|uniref:Uncharacterized protein n=1 Tax=Albugo candida TaxID=65357 RepID=A0A024FUJ6_9STRA|nr:unnamed protein product [Albugo candida]|eukprot:CCI10800.1 unnamed protein product [Albugo candida]